MALVATASASVVPERPAQCTVFTEFSSPPKLRFVRFVQPQHPPNFVATKDRGHVTVWLIVGVDGAVLDADVLRSTHKSLAAAVLAVAMSWRFEVPDFGQGPTCVNQIVDVEFLPDN
jgi:hypothetical protein